MNCLPLQTMLTFIAVCLLFAGESWALQKQSADSLSAADAQFCYGGLKVIYPELEVSQCTVLPPEFRKKISQAWGPPRVQLSCKDQEKYTLMMVDPDAPSRCKPTLACFRHWLVADILGRDLQKGQVKGSILSEYRRPTPPAGTGFHRYQFKVFKQQRSQTVALTTKEKASLGNWDPLAFAKRCHLGKPVAAVQFLTKNTKDGAATCNL